MKKNFLRKGFWALVILLLTAVTGKTYAGGCTTPGVPSGLTRTVNPDCSITFSWTNGSNTLDSEITICTDAAFTSNCIVISGESSPITIGGFSSGTTYFWRVRARNVGGAFQCFSAYVSGASANTGACTEPPDCSSCAEACGTCGFTTAPTVQQVVDNCDYYPYFPAITSGQTDTRCHQFQAINASVDFNVIISSTCGSGNVSAFSWTLQNSTCGGVIQSGNLNDLTFDGLTIGNIYTFCYTFTVPNPAPSGCSHSWHSPYFVGAVTVELPLELKDFSGINLKPVNLLSWSTLSERDNDYFTLERMSEDEQEWKTVAKIKGQGTTSTESKYEYSDAEFDPFAVNYYKLSQTDYNGNSEVLKTIVIDNRQENPYKLVNMLGQEVNENYKGMVYYIFENGKIIKTVH
ncbi:MAG: hypothetical protein ACO1O6_12340 [Bacteroidota bacterium]